MDRGQTPPRQGPTIEAGAYYDQFAGLEAAEAVSSLRQDAKYFEGRFAAASAWQSRDVAAGPKTIVDIGAGDGGVAMAAASHGHQVIGVEPSRVMAAHFRARAAGHPNIVDVRAGSATDLRGVVADHSTDVAMSNFVLVHLTREEGIVALDEMTRITRPGGWLIITTNVLTDGSRTLSHTHHTLRESVVNAAATTFYFWHERDLLAVLAGRGLAVVDQQSARHFLGDFHQIQLTLSTPERGGASARDDLGRPSGRA